MSCSGPLDAGMSILLGCDLVVVDLVVVVDALVVVDDVVVRISVTINVSDMSLFTKKIAISEFWVILHELLPDIVLWSFRELYHVLLVFILSVISFY